MNRGDFVSFSQQVSKIDTVGHRSGELGVASHRLSNKVSITERGDSAVRVALPGRPGVGLSGKATSRGSGKTCSVAAG